MVLALAACRLFDEFDLDTGEGTAALVTGDVHDMATGERLPGVAVCVYERDEIPCTTTDADGVFELAGVPVDEPVAIRFARESFRPALHTIVVPPDAGGIRITDYPLLTEALVALFVTMTGIVGFDPALGIGGIEARLGDGSPATGAAIALVPAAGIGPIYVDAEGIPDPTLTGVDEGGLAAWANLPAGRYGVQASWSLGSCAPSESSWKTPEGLSELLVVDGHLASTFSLGCAPTAAAR